MRHSPPPPPCLLSFVIPGREHSSKHKPRTKWCRQSKRILPCPASPTGGCRPRQGRTQGSCTENKGVCMWLRDLNKAPVVTSVTGNQTESWSQAYSVCQSVANLWQENMCGRLHGSKAQMIQLSSHPWEGWVRAAQAVDHWSSVGRKQATSGIREAALL